ncbi:hypothetical protein PMIT1313_00683 [Prochlorococcus marinus str. MIT 1313]|nr:hypothetical protein [Prochlorococcus marinus]KZR70037.1 hypothetical protein PMIT1313_00683 [Prochlorococcus marinus str. MIT 1313]KZR72761.1 hypothetical protein PMIT1318_00723 [Prochlorococcus marinus str. MIT 1318]
MPSYRQRGCYQSPSSGFVLPLALSASFLILLSSTSLHSLALLSLSRTRISTAERMRADQLRSAAQHFAQLATDSHACLLTWPSGSWNDFGSQCADADPSRLQQGLIGEDVWFLIDWIPSGDTGRLSLRLAAGARAVFLLAIDPDGPAVREVGAMRSLVTLEQERP